MHGQHRNTRPPATPNGGGGIKIQHRVGRYFSMTESLKKPVNTYQRSNVPEKKH